MDDQSEKYKVKYTKFFNWFFHIGVIINVLLVGWLYLMFFEIV